MKSKIFLLFFIFLNLSCSHYVDSNFSTEPISTVGIGLQSYRNYDVFRYKPSYKLTRDKEIIAPVSFEIKLPKRLLYYSGNNSFDFVFLYQKKQVVFVRTNLVPQRDSIYEPTSIEVENLLQTTSLPSIGKFDIEMIKRNSNKKNKIIKKRNALILLFNIEDNSMGQFTEFTSTFKNL